MSSDVPVAVRDDRPTTAVGRRARLELVFSAYKGRTVLTHGYAEPPLRLGHGFERGAGLHFILASSAPGIFGGDEIVQVIRVEPGAIVSLASQSALQMHPSSAGVQARLTSRYAVEAGGSLSCWWDPIIPFARSRLDQSIAIDVADGGRLTWSDALMSGRSGRGERWAFSHLSHELRVRQQGRLAYLERYRIAPNGDTGVDAAVHLPFSAPQSEVHYVGTVLRIGYADDPAMADAVHRSVQGFPGVAAAADRLAGDLLLVRLAADGGVPFHGARQAAIDACGVPIEPNT